MSLSFLVYYCDTHYATHLRIYRHQTTLRQPITQIHPNKYSSPTSKAEANKNKSLSATILTPSFHKHIRLMALHFLVSPNEKFMLRKIGVFS